MLTRKECAEAWQHAASIVQSIDDWLESDGHVDGADRAYLEDMRKMARQLQRLLAPPPTPEEILLKIPGERVKDKIAAIGISRQYWYNLINAESRPSRALLKSLAAATATSEAVLRTVW